MNGIEDALAMAQRHVLELEDNVARQEALVAELDREKHPGAAAHAREVLTTFRQSLELAREHLQLERVARDMGLRQNEAGASRRS